MTGVTVIGLGQMGAKLAELLLRANQSVTIWNRSADKALPLVERGAVLATDASAAIAASAVTIVCVYDYVAANKILQSECVAAALDGRVVINLGTGSPEEACAVDDYVTRHGGRYLDGAIQAAPSQMGQEDTPVLISGDQQALKQVSELLGILAGNVVNLGARVDAAAFMDLATLSYVYGAFGGFLHGALIAEGVGIDVGTFGGIVADISPTFGTFFKHEGTVISSGEFEISESPMRISITAVRRILETSNRLKINTELPSLISGWLDQAELSGFADEELAAVIKALRSPTPLSHEPVHG